MASYYYLISSLPMLSSSGNMPISYEEFLRLCRSHLSEHKFSLLKNLTLSSSDGALVSEWHEFYGILEKELAYQRNVRLGNSAEPPYGRDEMLTRAVASAMNEKNPLEAEKMLLSLEFEKLDALIGTHYFDDEALMGYALKLKLLERKTSFDKAEGRAELDRIVGGLEQQIVNMGQEN